MRAKPKQNGPTSKRLSVLKKFNIRECFVRLNSFENRQTVNMEQPQPVVRKRGRPSLASKLAESKTSGASPVAKPVEKPAVKKLPPKKREPTTPVVVAEEAEGAGRSRRTPKPNPKYMNDDTVVASTKSLLKDDSASEDDDDEDDERPVESREDDGSDDTVTPVARKKRGRPPKSATGKLTAIKKAALFMSKSANASPTVAGRKTLVPASAPAKRKIAETEIDIDDDRGKQLFLDAKRRLTHVSICLLISFN